MGQGRAAAEATRSRRMDSPRRAVQAGRQTGVQARHHPPSRTHVVQLLVPLLHPGALDLLDLVAVHDVQDLVTHSLQGQQGSSTAVHPARRSNQRSIKRPQREGSPPACIHQPVAHLCVASPAHGGQHLACPLLRLPAGAAVGVGDGVGQPLLGAAQDARLQGGGEGQAGRGMGGVKSGARGARCARCREPYRASMPAPPSMLTPAAQHSIPAIPPPTRPPTCVL